MRQVSQQASAALHLSSHIEQIAAIYALGTPHTKYQTQNERIETFFGLIWMMYVAIFISIIFFFFISNADRTWWVWLAWLLSILISFLCIRFFLAWLLSPHIEVFVCPEGLIYSKKDLLEVIRWDQVEAYWENVSISHDSETTDKYSYSLQRSDGMKFEFPNEIANVQTLGELMEQKVDRQLLPRTIAAYHAGIPITFGDITAKQQEISVEGGRKILPWSEFESFSLGKEMMDMYRKGQESAWHQQRIAPVANPRVLQGLVDHIVQELAQQQLPRVIAAYHAGSPIVFGRISLSLQGIAIDSGKKVLSWSDVRKVDVDVKQRQVSISSHSKLLSWQTLPTWMTPNTLVLKGLIDYALRVHMHHREAWVQGQLPQALASYNAGIPLTFGRISLSLQGIAIDGGKQFLPWSKVSRLYVGIYIGGERLTIAKKGKVLAWQTLPISELGDVDLLQRLIEHVMHEQSF